MGDMENGHKQPTNQKQWAMRDSNPQSRDYESPALTVKLIALTNEWNGICTHIEGLCSSALVKLSTLTKNYITSEYDINNHIHLLRDVFQKIKKRVDKVKFQPI